MKVKILLALCISAGTISLTSSQSCTNEGAEVFNPCGESCFCNNGRMENCCRMRKDFTSMTRAERRRYVGAVRRVSTEAQFRNEYRQLIDLHQRIFQTGIHQQNMFLPWHRWYILRYENLLRRADCRVTLPYWDWSLFSMTPWRTGRNRIWYGGPSGLGGNGGRGGCVRNGPFRTHRKTNGQCLRRRFNGLPPDIIAVYLTQLHQPNVAGFNTFELNLRVNLHDTVHCRVGGDMCTVTSANAPEFFLHHGFIDKIWANWQEYSAQHMRAHFLRLNRMMTETGYRTAQFIDSVNLPDIETRGRNPTCVLYEDPTHREYGEILQRLEGMTPQQIRAVPRHSFAPLNPRQMRFFNINRQERRQARRNLRQLEPRNELTGTAGLTGIDRNTGFRLSSLPVNNRKKRSVLRRKENTMRDRWMAKNIKQ